MWHWNSGRRSHSQRWKQENLMFTYSQNKYNCKEYPKSTQTAWRHGLSLQATADVMNSFLEDQNNNCLKNGQPKMHDESDFLSKHKIQNMRNRYGKEFVENHAQSGPYKCLGLDGKKGKKTAQLQWKKRLQ